MKFRRESGSVSRMHRRLLALAFPLVLVACKKETPAPGAAASASAAASVAPAAPAEKKGESLAILKDFEGQISWVTKGKLAGPPKGGAAELKLALLVKDNRFRLELPAGFPGAPPGGNAYVIGHPQQKKFYTVVDAQKQAVLIDAEKLSKQMEAMGGKAGGPGAAEPAAEVKKTGKVEQVAGYGCEVWQITHKASKMELCTAAEGIAWFQLPVAKLPPQYGFLSELADGKHFPLRLIVFDPSGVEEGRLELTSIEKKKLDGVGFDVPAGYQVIDLEQMMAGLMQNLAGMRGRPGTLTPHDMPGLAQGLPSAFARPPATGSTPRPAAPKKQR
jgi:hypothetical protein